MQKPQPSSIPKQQTTSNDVISIEMDDPSNATSPLIKCLPPATDYIDYLTILEYNVTKDNLPLLNEILQDAELTTNIGWDLLQILLPLLSESRACLKTVERLGNPREVLLKADIALRALDFSLDENDSGEEEDDHKGEGATATSLNIETAPISIQQVLILVSMLDALHSRIKTKYPSRFLSTTLQGVLQAIRQLKQDNSELFSKWRNVLCENLLSLVRHAWRSPNLPPRPEAAKDPASSTSAATEPVVRPDAISPEEDALISRLLQSYLTHIIELFVPDSIDEDHVSIPGMARTIKLQAKLHPEKLVARDQFILGQFEAQNTYLNAWQSAFDRMKSLASSIGITHTDISAVIFEATSDDASVGDENEVKDSLPQSAADVPLSAIGCLHLFAARSIALSDATTSMRIFPEHVAILRQFINSENNPRAIGSEPPCVIDAVLALGMTAVELGQIGEAPEDEFLQYLQTMSLLSANTPNPSLRYYAHSITTSVLASYPSQSARLGFIMDTLTECPFENLQASAVGWFKDEILRVAQAHDDVPEPASVSKATLEAFSKAIFVPPELQNAGSPSTAEKWEMFKAKLNFHLATLNFYYLLISAEPLKKQLDPAELHRKLGLRQGYLEPFRHISTEFHRAIQDGDKTSSGVDTEEVTYDLMILDDVLDRIYDKLGVFGWG